MLMNATISKGSPNPRSALGESHQTQGPPLLLVESPKDHQTQGLPFMSLVKPKTNILLVKSLKTRQTQDKDAPGRISKHPLNPRSPLGESHQTKEERTPNQISKGWQNPRSVLGEPLYT